MARHLNPAHLEARLLPLVLIAVSAVSSLAFACVTPFAAFAVAAAYALPPRAALISVAGVWLVNQAIGAAAILATTLAGVALRVSSGNIVVALVTALAMAFGAYEASLFLVTFALGGQEAFTPVIGEQYALLDLGWAIALVGTWEIFSRARGIGNAYPFSRVG